MKQDNKKLASHRYIVPIYSITDQGLESVDVQSINIVKGSKENSDGRQSGMIVENLLELCIDHLMTVNEGHLHNRDTALAIIKLEDALLRLNKRTLNRRKRNVEVTYNA